MAEGRTSTSSRPLTRSLDPLAGESVGGYLLRLACRLRLSPIGLARLTGCTKHPAATQLGRRLLLDLDVPGFARATRLSSDEAAALTLVPWADRYPPIARSLTVGARRPQHEDWLFNDIPRYCPQCLVGDRSSVQQDYGGPWKTTWHLPITFACPDHELFLQHGCPLGHPPGRAAQLIAQAADSTLHPAQCRHPDPDQPASRGRKGRSCGAHLDQPEGPGPPRPSTSMLKTQRRLLDLLGPSHPAEEAAARFTDLRVVTALLCTTWPSGRDMIGPGARSAVDEHVRALSAGSRQAFDRPPRDPAAAAALLTAASALLDAPDLGEVLAQHSRATREGRPSRVPWTQVYDRHESSCSENLRQAAAPVTRAYRRTGFRGTKAPIRAGGYRPEHIPAFLEQHWHEKHLAPLQLGSRTKFLRRLGAVLLVQWAAGGAMGDAADFLGINPAGGQYAATTATYRWLSNQGPDLFTKALRDIAEDLDLTSGLTDYRRRREALQNWSLTPGTWHEIITALPPVPGPVRPSLDDRKRQEASAYIWARITGGEPLFAPRPIEAGQPDHVRRAWLLRRANTWFQLTRPDPLSHYAALRARLNKYAGQITKKIDDDTETRWFQQSRPGST
jgi:hypothetical protein